MSSAEWPARTEICIDCRTLTVAGAGCPIDGRHRVTRLDTHAGREGLLTEVWGPPSRRRRAKKLAKAGAGGAAGGSAAEGASCSGCGDVGAVFELEGALILLGILALAGVVMLIYYGVQKLVEAVRKWRNRPRPAAAAVRRVRMPRRRGRVGTVRPRDGAVARAPLSDRECVAYSIELHSERALDGTVMARDAATIGFDIELDDGEVVRVPAGAIVLGQGEAESADDRVEPGEDEIWRYLLAIDPLRREAEYGEDEAAKYDPMAHDRTRERVIEVGARVEIRGPLRRVVDGGSAASSSAPYRQAAASALVPEGAARIVPAR